MKSFLKPTAHLRVYELVQEAGLDVSAWANFKGKHPASNPQYSYEWAFVEDDRVAVCLWHDDMQEKLGIVFQDRNYRTLKNTRPSWTALKEARARRMDEAIRLAWEKKLPIRVIVVDPKNPPPPSTIKPNRCRLLDPVPWFVASYDDDGNCRLQRQEGEFPSSPQQVADEPTTERNRLARISFNSSGWQRPTGEAGERESDETYNAQNKFGHEDWLFRSDWLLDGWRYSFLQCLNRKNETYMGQPLNVTLYTIEADQRRRLVATIYDLESLSNRQAEDALQAFREIGWLKIMQDQVKEIGGNPKALGSPEWASHVLNMRFRLENVEIHGPDSYLPEDKWLKNNSRYQNLFRFPQADRERFEKIHQGRRGTQETPEANRLFRQGTKPITYTPEHALMQAKLLEELRAEYGKEHVLLEEDFVDARVETNQELIFFEIKSDLDPRAVIRQALGQILEYAYHPIRKGRRPDRLVIVGRNALSTGDSAYLKLLSTEFKLPLSYRVVSL